MDNKNYVKKIQLDNQYNLFFSNTQFQQHKKKHHTKMILSKQNLPIYPSTQFSLDRTHKSRAVQPKLRIEKSI